MTDAIPQCSPLASYQAQAGDIDAAFKRVLAAGRYILGDEVAAFEREFASVCGATDAIGVANGTDAIELALRALDVGAGDAVVTVSLSAVATAVGIRATGAIPLFVDVDPVDGLIDPGEVERLLAAAQRGDAPVPLDRIRAILPVHLYGRCADMTALGDIARRYGLPVVEDCAQAHGARHAGRPAGSFGDAACFSFYPTKNLGAIGDGGAVVASGSLAARVRLLRQYGWRQRYVSEVEGTNSRLDELQAAVLRVKLERLAHDNLARRALAAAYRDGISHPLVTVAADDAGHVYHQFVVRSPRRDALQRHLAELGIGTLVHYPAAIHEQPAYADPAYRPLPLPQTERWTREVLSLPMFPQLPPSDVQAVVDAINQWTGH